MGFLCRWKSKINSNLVLFFIAMLFWLGFGSYNIYCIESNRFSPPEVDDAYNLLLRVKISKDLEHAYTQPALLSLHDQVSTPPPDPKSSAARWRERVYFRIFHQYHLAWNLICNFFISDSGEQESITHAYYNPMYVVLVTLGLGIFFSSQP